MTRSDRAGGTSSLALPFLLTAALVLGLASWATCAAYATLVGRAVAGQVHARAAIVIHDIGAAIEQRMSLGLELAAMSEIQDLIERRRALDPGILSIEVFDGAGRSLFNTDRGLIGEPVPEAWRSPALRAGQTTWVADDFESEVVGLPLSTSFGTAAGGVVLRYSRTWLREHVKREDERIGLAGLTGFAIGLLVAGLGFALVLRPAEQALVRAARGEPPAPSPPRSLVPLLNLAYGFREDAAARAARLDQGAAAIQRIDDET